MYSILVPKRETPEGNRDPAGSTDPLGGQCRLFFHPLLFLFFFFSETPRAGTGICAGGFLCDGRNKKAMEQTFHRLFQVEVTGLEPAASWSQTTRATSCATPRDNFSIIRGEARCVKTKMRQTRKAGGKTGLAKAVPGGTGNGCFNGRMNFVQRLLLLRHRPIFSASAISSSRKSGWAMPISASARSQAVSPFRRAMPYSVTR